jgi:hypothetical protein
VKVAEDGHVTPVVKVKISAGPDATAHGLRQTCWTGPGLMAAATFEHMLRMWDLSNDENYNLTLGSGITGQGSRDKISAVAYHPTTRHLSVGISGHCGTWNIQ